MKQAHMEQSETPNKSMVGQYWHNSGVLLLCDFQLIGCELPTGYLFNKYTLNAYDVPGIFEVLGYSDKQDRQGPSCTEFTI